MNRRSQILFLVHRVPYPPNRGDRIRSFNLLKFLSERADVHLAFLAESEPSTQTMSVLGDKCRRVQHNCIAAGRLGRRTRWAKAAWSLARGRTATEGLFASNQLREIVERWARETAFDAVVVFCSSMVQYTSVPGLNGVPVIVDLVDVDSQKWHGYADGCRGPGRLFFRLEARRLRRLEATLAQAASAVTLVSEAEAQLYRGHCPNDITHAVPNGVDLDYFSPADFSIETSLNETGLNETATNGPPAAGRVTFVGALNYRANIDGINWFVENAWPAIHDRFPQATFDLVGSNPTPIVGRIARREGVRLIGQVDDVRPHLAEADVVVAPLRVARGIQNKVLEALAMGKAVVASPQAAEGIAITPGEHLLVAKTPGQWSQAVGRLFSQTDLRASLGRAGRDYVEKNHRWEVQLAPFATLPGLAGVLSKDPIPATADDFSPVESAQSNA